MANRFTDTEKWKKAFLRSLKAPYKLLWFYICDDCNHAGIWEVDIDVAALRIGESVDAVSALGALSEKIIPFDGGKKWFIPSFIEFQYPGGLDQKNRAHSGVIRILKKYRLVDEELKPLTRPLDSPFKGCKDMDMDKELEMDEGGAGETPAAPIPPPAEQSIVGEMAAIWKKANPDYPLDNATDGHALFEIGQFVSKLLQGKWPPETDVGRLALLETWDRLARWIAADDFYKSWALAQIARTKNLQTIWQKSREVKNGATATKSGRSGNRKAQGTDELIDIVEGDIRAFAAGSEGP